MANRWYRIREFIIGFMVFGLMISSLLWLAFQPILFPDLAPPTVAPSRSEPAMPPAPPTPSPAVGPAEFSMDVESNGGAFAAKGMQWTSERSGDGLTRFRITRVESGSFFDKGGLKEGDVINMVDGKPLTRDKARSLYNAASDGKTLHIDLERGGRPVQMDLASPK